MHSSGATPEEEEREQPLLSSESEPQVSEMHAVRFLYLVHHLIHFEESSFRLLWLLLCFADVGVLLSVLLLCPEDKRGADKSLARTGRKQATVTKLGFIQHTPHEAQYTS